MKVAFVFPGQGSQFVGMCRDLYDEYQEIRNVFDEADEALGISLTKLIFDGPEEQLRLTYNTQPALLTASVACGEALRKNGVDACVVAGHSLGEYSALVYAGVLRFYDAVVAVRYRGRYMQEAVPVGEGGMAAVIGFDSDAIVSVCQKVEQDSGEVVQAVNFNCPGQVVVAGSARGIDLALVALKTAGARRVVKLPVSAPFHSSLMKPAAEKLAAFLDKTDFADVQVPVYANVTGDKITDAKKIKRLLVEQAAAPVMWEKIIRSMIAEGADTFVEVGPGRVLSGFTKKIAKGVRILNVEDTDSLCNTLKELQVE